jgi:hypothetical protein
MSSIVFQANTDFECILKFMGQSFTESHRGFGQIIFQLVFVLEKISPRLNNQDKHQIERHFSNYIRNFFFEGRTTVIHVVVAEKNLETDLIQYILQLGADPKAKDDDGQTPFHVMAGRRVAYRDGNWPIFRALVHAAGSHLDTAKMNRDTVLNLLKTNLAGFRGSADGVDVEVDAYFSSLLNAVSSLTCCCARVIRRRSDSSYSPAIRLSSQR